MKRYFAISTSPRKGGNGDATVHAVAEAIRAQGAQVDEFFFRDLKVNYCTGCCACKKEGQDFCVQEDDATRLMRTFPDYDGYIFATPLYMCNMCGQAKVFFDRCYCLTKPVKRPAMPAGGPGPDGKGMPPAPFEKKQESKQEEPPMLMGQTKSVVYDGHVMGNSDVPAKKMVIIFTSNSMRADQDKLRAETIAFQFKDMGVQDYKLLHVPGCHPFDGGGKREENLETAAEVGRWLAE